MNWVESFSKHIESLSGTKYSRRTSHLKLGVFDFYRKIPWLEQIALFPSDTALLPYAAALSPHFTGAHWGFRNPPRRLYPFVTLPSGRVRRKIGYVDLSTGRGLFISVVYVCAQGLTAAHELRRDFDHKIRSLKKRTLSYPVFPLLNSVDK